MKSYKERVSDAVSVLDEGERRVATTKEPEGQKFKKGTFVDIAEDLGPTMRFFEHGCPARVEYTYAHAFPGWGGDESTKEYSLLVRLGQNDWESHSWYDEWQLTEITDETRIALYKKELGE